MQQLSYNWLVSPHGIQTYIHSKYLHSGPLIPLSRILNAYTEKLAFFGPYLDYAVYSSVFPFTTLSVKGNLLSGLSRMIREYLFYTLDLFRTFIA
jgi:hypothetical protein